MSLCRARAVPSNPLSQLAYDRRFERAGKPGAKWPPGDTRFSLRRTHPVATEPLKLLLDAYERHGPSSPMRILSSQQVFMLGPEANHFILVSRRRTSAGATAASAS